MFNIFKKKKDNNKNQKDNISKNKKLSGSAIRILVNRLLNGTPVQIADFEAELIRDENNNTVLFDDDMDFKEEMPGIQDTLVSDIIYKLKSRTITKDKQIELIKKLIKEQEEIIKSEKNGFITKEVEEYSYDQHKTIKVNREIKINRQTEMSKLRVLKCSKYTLENKDGEGCFESIDINGNRCLSYVLIDGELIPYWFKTPTSEGEPVILVPDVVGRKKFFKEAETEAIQDFNEGVDWFWKGWLGVAMKLLTVIFFSGLIFWTSFLVAWSSDLYDQSLEPKIQQLELENQKTAQLCNQNLAQQIENNEEIFNYAKAKMKEETSIITPIDQNTDKSNIQI